MEESKTLQINEIINTPYKYGFSTKIDSEIFPKGTTIICYIIQVQSLKRK